MYEKVSQTPMIGIGRRSESPPTRQSMSGLSRSIGRTEAISECNQSPLTWLDNPGEEYELFRSCSIHGD